MKAAFFHAEFDVVQPSLKQSAIKVACYNAAARVRLADGTSYNFSRKRGEHRGHVVMLPAGAPAWAADAGKLWIAAEAAERQWDGQPARLVEFAIPREVPPEQRMAFAQAIVAPWVRDGMAAQLDIHLITGSDGLEQPHAHVLLTMRRFDADGAFETAKVREWNTDFRRRADDGTGKMVKGQHMRGLIASRMNDWMAQNGIEARVDHRKAAAWGDDTPTEKNVSKKSWEAYKRRPDSAAAGPVREALETRQARRQLRQAQRAAVYYEAAAKTIGRELDSRRPGLRAPARKQGFVWDSKWSPKVEGYIAGVEINGRFAAINLSWGGQIKDYGSRIVVSGKADWRAAMALADHATRRGLKSVEITGNDPKFRAALAAQLAARGIAATNERKPSAYAIAQARDLTARAMAPRPVPPKPEPAKPEPPKPRPMQPEPEPTGPKAAPKLIPPWARDPGWSNKTKEGERR